MPNEPGRSDFLPIWWIGRLPIYVTTMLVTTILVGMLATVVLATARIPLTPFEFNPALFWQQGCFWQLLTHPFVNSPSFFFIFGLFCMYSFGIGVETFLGRRIFLQLCGLMCLVPALTTTGWWLAGVSGSYSGDYNFFIGVFIAYATLYPNAEYWNWITMKWLAFAGLAICSLMYFPARDWYGLSILFAVAGAAHLYMRYERGHIELPDLRFWKKKPRFRVVQREPVRSQPGSAPESRGITDMDALLDKIAKSGIASLTAKERSQLEQAREELLKKDRR